jgi:hypothetical protein
MTSKIKKGFALILALAISATLLVGCGGSKISGRYDFVSMQAETVTITAEEMATYGMDPKDTFIEFKDGDFSLSMLGVNVEGTYTQSGNTITLSLEGDTITGKLDGKTLTIDFGDYYDATMVFEQK